MRMHTLFIIGAALLSGTAVHAGEYQIQELHIDQPFARETAPHQPAAGTYLAIENRGTTTDRLLSVASPIAKSVQIHTMSMQGNVMRMREVQALELKPGSRIEMVPGKGNHLMLIGLKRPLKAGESFPLTLVFDKAGTTEVAVMVRDMKAGGGGNGAVHRGH